ncbi:hypothetical protein EI555_005868 [Monodon monoceros]|uniref:E3 ubiquitin-protein ligase Arkadia N-terminal domain-containing protein n=1 Tax=Monodon monoceros TaxID=40151 RepID=A0A4U1FIK7_MONMO|nr:hypothetical protein EI555_005868 [Monodon monoceros]
MAAKKTRQTSDKQNGPVAKVKGHRTQKHKERIRLLRQKREAAARKKYNLLQDSSTSDSDLTCDSSTSSSDDAEEVSGIPAEIPGHLDPRFLASDRTSAGNAPLSEEINIASSHSEVEIVRVQQHARVLGIFVVWSSSEDVCKVHSLISFQVHFKTTRPLPLCALGTSIRLASALEQFLQLKAEETSVVKGSFPSTDLWTLSGYGHQDQTPQHQGGNLEKEQKTQEKVRARSQESVEGYVKTDRISDGHVIHLKNIKDQNWQRASPVRRENGWSWLGDFPPQMSELAQASKLPPISPEVFLVLNPPGQLCPIASCTRT